MSYLNASQQYFGLLVLGCKSPPCGLRHHFHLQRGNWKVPLSINLDDCNIRFPISSYDLGLKLPLIGEPDHDLLRILNHMIIG